MEVYLILGVIDLARSSIRAFSVACMSDRFPIRDYRFLVHMLRRSFRSGNNSQNASFIKHKYRDRLNSFSQVACISAYGTSYVQRSAKFFSQVACISAYVQRLAKNLFPGWVYFCMTLPRWCLAKQKNFLANLCKSIMSWTFWLLAELSLICYVK